MLLHLLQAMIVGVNEVKGQRSSERATSSTWGHAKKPAKHTNNNQITQPENHDTANKDIEHGQDLSPADTYPLFTH